EHPSATSLEDLERWRHADERRRVQIHQVVASRNDLQPPRTIEVGDLVLRGLARPGRSFRDVPDPELQLALLNARDRYDELPRVLGSLAFDPEVEAEVVMRAVVG